MDPTVEQLILAELTRLRVLVEQIAAGRAVSPILTVAEAAEMMRCSPRRVFQLIASGDLRAGAKAGKRRVVDRASVVAYLGAPAPEKPPKRRRQRRSRAAVLAAELAAAKAHF